MLIYYMEQKGRFVAIDLMSR
jgi:hypothetical protein